MPDDIQQVQTVKSWKDRGLDFAFNQGPAVLILIAITVFFGYFIYNEMPKRDAVWSKVLADQTIEFKKILEERDVRNLAYRTKADERHEKEVQLLVADFEKQYKRLETLMVALQKQGVVLEKKIEAMQ